MFLTLLLATFILSVAVSFIVIKVFKTSIASILSRIIKDEISLLWSKYITFAAFVVGISGGVRIYQLERYISAPHKDTDILVPNQANPE